MSQIWQDLVIVGVPIAEKIIRPILVYIFLIVGLRLAGKRELAQLNALAAGLPQTEEFDALRDALRALADS